MTIEAGNLGRNERLISAVAGTLLAALTARSGGVATRLLFGLAAAGFIARAFAGHCAMKAALTGESTLAEGINEQWRLMRARASAPDSRSAYMSAAAVAAAEKPMREQAPATEDSSGYESRRMRRAH